MLPGVIRTRNPSKQSVSDTSRRPGFDPQTVQPVASRYTVRAIPAHEVMSGNYSTTCQYALPRVVN
jgi:hypothetical protein